MRIGTYIVDHLRERFRQLEATEAQADERLKIFVDSANQSFGAISALDRAARGGHADFVRLLISCGANVNCTRKNGQTPAHGAAMYGRNGILQLLKEAGADMELQDAQGNTALDLARSHGFHDSVQCLTTDAVSAGIQARFSSSAGDKELAVQAPTGTKAALSED